MKKEEDISIKNLSPEEVERYAGSYVVSVDGVIVFVSSDLNKAVKAFMRAVYAGETDGTERKIDFFRVPPKDSILF